MATAVDPKCDGSQAAGTYDTGPGDVTVVINTNPPEQVYAPEPASRWGWWLFIVILALGAAGYLCHERLLAWTQRQFPSLTPLFRQDKARATARDLDLTPATPSTRTPVAPSMIPPVAPPVVPPAAPRSTPANPPAAPRTSAPLPAATQGAPATVTAPPVVPLTPPNDLDRRLDELLRKNSSHGAR